MLIAFLLSSNYVESRYPGATDKGSLASQRSRPVGRLWVLRTNPCFAFKGTCSGVRIDRKNALRIRIRCRTLAGLARSQCYSSITACLRIAKAKEKLRRKVFGAGSEILASNYSLTCAA